MSEDMPSSVMSAYLSLLLEEVWRFDHALVEFMDEIPAAAKQKLSDLIIDAAERRSAQAKAACEMICDDLEGSDV